MDLQIFDNISAKITFITSGIKSDITGSCSRELVSWLKKLTGGAIVLLEIPLNTELYDGARSISKVKVKATNLDTGKSIKIKLKELHEKLFYNLIDFREIE